MLVSPEEASEVVVILGKFIIIKPCLSLCSNLPRSRIKVSQKRKKEGFGPWADTIFSFLHVELQMNFPWTFRMYRVPESTHNVSRKEMPFGNDLKNQTIKLCTCCSECGVLYEHPDIGYPPAVLPSQGLRLVPGKHQRHQTGGHRAPALRGQQRQPSAKQLR